MQTSIFLRIDDTHALGADDMQWIVYRSQKAARPLGLAPRDWKAVSFVSSTKDILQRCMREKGVPPDTAASVVAGLPSTFAEWKGSNPSHKGTPRSVERVAA